MGGGGGADGTTLVLSIDLSVEGVHFRTDWLSFREIGWRATAAALSDLAAEAAEPIGVLVSLGVPGNRQRRSGNAAPATEIMAGVGAAARSVGASRSEERRVGEEWRSPWAPDHLKKKTR